MRSNTAQLISKMGQKSFKQRLRQLRRSGKLNQAKVSSPRVRRSSEVAHRISATSDGIVRSALEETEKLASQRSQLKLRKKKLGLTQQATRDFCLGLFNRNVDELIKQVDSDLGQFEPLRQLLRPLGGSFSGSPKKLLLMKTPSLPTQPDALSLAKTFTFKVSRSRSIMPGLLNFSSLPRLMYGDSSDGSTSPEKLARIGLDLANPELNKNGRHLKFHILEVSRRRL